MGAVMAIEEPKFSILEKSPPFEVRSYAPMILAEAQTEGDLDEASSQGFRLIAGYIFGQNQLSEKIAMTVPVAVEEQVPKSARIQIPAVKRAVIIFTGFNSENKVAEKTLELEEWMKSKNLQAVGVPKFARYNPPWSIPFMRRNEIMIDVRD